MDSAMHIDLAFADEAFCATAAITPAENVSTNNISFLLNKDLLISAVRCNGSLVDIGEITEEQPICRPPVYRYTFKSRDAIRRLEIAYAGTVCFSPEAGTCWHNTLTKDFKSLSWYSAWYPQEVSIPISHDMVAVKEGKAYFVVKGDYDAKRDIWLYGGKGYDPFNIVAYRKESVRMASNGIMHIYYMDEGIEGQSQKCMERYGEIIGFYNGGLFPKREIPVLDIACASPAIIRGGGYQRAGLLWCTDLGKDDLWLTWQIAHETAHNWCSGAQADTWEDWLNETTAEWAVLLFALNRNDDVLFDFIMEPKLRKSASLPAIRTPDGTRPEGVHDQGTVMIYQLYQTLGVEAVRLFVQAFAGLKQKDTASLIEALDVGGHGEIARFIQEEIV